MSRIPVITNAPRTSFVVEPHFLAHNFLDLELPIARTRGLNCAKEAPGFRSFLAPTPATQPERKLLDLCETFGCISEFVELQAELIHQ